MIETIRAVIFGSAISSIIAAIIIIFTVLPASASTSTGICKHLPATSAIAGSAAGAAGGVAATTTATTALVSGSAGWGSAVIASGPIGWIAAGSAIVVGGAAYLGADYYCNKRKKE